MELARRCLCWISCESKQRKDTRLRKENSSRVTIPPKYRSSHLLQLVTHIEVRPGVFKDELRGVGFVLTVTDVHLKFISLSAKKQQQRNVFKTSVRLTEYPNLKRICTVSNDVFFFFTKKFVYPSDEAMADVFWKLLILLQLLQEDAERIEHNMKVSARKLVTLQAVL